VCVGTWAGTCSAELGRQKARRDSGCTTPARAGPRPQVPHRPTGKNQLLAADIRSPSRRKATQPPRTTSAALLPFLIPATSQPMHSGKRRADRCIHAAPRCEGLVSCCVFCRVLFGYF
jgi:hypothetical protein